MNMAEPPVPNWYVKSSSLENPREVTRTVEHLYRWFGGHRFGVRSLNDDMVGTLADILRLRSNDKFGRRMELGRVLHGIHGIIFVVTGVGPVQFLVQEYAEQDKPGTYQIQFIPRDEARPEPPLTPRLIA